jgi:hypothetical protein
MSNISKYRSLRTKLDLTKREKKDAIVGLSFLVNTRKNKKINLYEFNKITEGFDSIIKTCKETLDDLDVSIAEVQVYIKSKSVYAKHLQRELSLLGSK